MKNLIRLAAIFFLASVVLVGCKDDNDDVVPEDTTDAFVTLKTYMESNSLDLTDVLTSWITTATDVNDNLDNYYVMDIRSADDFALGHIPGAVNTTLGTIVADAANADKPIIVVCYTGQTAGHAVMALRLSGYADAMVLKFGMSSWHDDFAGSWSSNIGDVAIDHANWSLDVDEPSVPTFDYPTFTTTSTDGAAILAERVAVLTAGFNGVVNTTVLDTPSDYLINNYWAIDSWEHYGHIDGAVRVNPLDLSNINVYDPDQTVVTYCYTGQTSSMITAYLKVLGYDALSLKFGANGMIHSNMESHTWTTESPAGFDYEVSK